jgi:pimeloyl-ACP methyl ester carboxylesterase
VLRAFLDGRVYGNQRGEDPPRVLALHGWQRTLADFDGVLSSRNPAVDDPFHGEVVASVALDLPGFGTSPPPPASWGSKEYAEALLPLLDEFDDSAVVLGHSFGGRVALQLAVIAPQRIRGLVLTGVPFGFGSANPRPKADPRYRLIRRAADWGLIRPTRLERARHKYGSRDYREASGIMRDVLVVAVQENYEALLPRVAGPVELIWGENDTVVPVGVAKASVGSFADARLTILEGIGHLVPTEQPAALRSALGRWA